MEQETDVERDQLERRLARSRLRTDLLRESHRLSAEIQPIEHISERLLRVLLGGLGAICGALLRCGPDGTLTVRAAHGVDRDELEEMAAPEGLGDFHVVDGGSGDGPAGRFLLRAAGGAPVVWRRDPGSSVALLLRLPPQASADDDLRELLDELLRLVDEVTRRRLELRMLRESEDRFRSFVENMGDAAFRADLEGRVTYVNRAASELTGIPDEELLGMSFLELFQISSAERAAAAHARLVAGESQEDEVVFGNGRTVHVVAEPLRDHNGQVVGVFGTARDITRRYQEEEFLRKLVHNSLQGLLIIQDEALVFVNDAAAVLLGVPAGRLSLMSLREVLDRWVHPADREMIWTRFQSRSRGENPPERYEFRTIRSDGSEQPVEMFACRTVYRGRQAVQAALIPKAAASDGS